MSDYDFSVSILRDQMAQELRHNDEQLIYVIASALSGGGVDDAIALGSLEEDAAEDKDRIVANLRQIADAIESGEVS